MAPRKNCANYNLNISGNNLLIREEKSLELKFDATYVAQQEGVSLKMKRSLEEI